MKVCVFDSMYGYSCVLRLGKIYRFDNNHYTFLMNINKDIIDYSSVLHRFIILCKYKLRQKIFVFMFNPIKDLQKRELGLISIHKLMNTYYDIYFDKK